MKRAKKASNGAGSVERRGDLWWAQVSLPRAPGQKLRRKRVPIAGSEKMSRGEAKRESAKIARDVREGRIVFDETPNATRVAPSGPASDWSTVRKLGEAWTSGEMLKRFGRVNKLREKANAKNDAWTLAAHVYEVKTRGPNGPAFGDLLVADVTSDDVAAVMGAQPAEQRAQTRINQYNRLHRLFDLAEFPCRLRPEGSNPVRRYLRPEADAEKLFCFLYPSEVVALLVCKHIPLARRVLYALGTYTGQRRSSLFAQRWKHVDFDHGTLASFRTKTGRAQYFVADRGLMKLLEAWYALSGEPDDEQFIIPAKDIGCEPRHLAMALRDDLKLAGVTRSILFEDDADNVEPLRFHDLRSTFCTWARRAGYSDRWISERTGHDIDGNMINRYDRGAQTLTDLGYAPFPKIGLAIPELKEVRLHTRLHRLKARRFGATTVNRVVSVPLMASPVRFERTTPGLGRRESRTAGAEERENTSPIEPVEPLATPQIDVCNEMGNPVGNATEPVDAVEAALARALDAAAAAGRFDVVAQIAKELEARRLASVPNVVALDPSRLKRRGS